MFVRSARRALCFGLVGLMLWGQAPSELWATGVEGIADAVATSGESLGEGSNPGSGANGQGSEPQGGDSAEGANSNSSGLGDGPSSEGSSSTTSTDAVRTDESSTSNSETSGGNGDAAQGASNERSSALSTEGVQLSGVELENTEPLEGQVEIYSVVIQNPADESSVFRVGDQAVAKAREKGAPSGIYIDPELLTFQWQVSDTKNGTYQDLDEATSDTLEIDESLEGKFIKCVVSAKVGTSTYARTVNLPIAARDAVNVTSVTLDASGKVNVGDTLTATATASTGDVTNGSHVTWSWYYGDSSYATNTRIEGASGNTLVVTEDLLSKYIEARADGGFGEEDSSAVGPVVEPGAVELYQVTVAGDARIGSTLTATAYKGNSSTEVSPGDVVRYQWQYADSKTTSDSAFTDIPGAIGSTYVITADMQGKYLRVRATSDGSVVSTEKPSYGTTWLVDPLGPVTVAGQYTLTAVELESSGQAAQAGNAITPTAMVKGAYYGDDPVPDDAELTFVWEVQGEDGSWSRLEGVDYHASTGELELDDALVGKTLRVSASALDNTVTSASFTVLAAGTYDLLRVTTSPLISSSTTQLFTGDAVSATVQAKRLDGSETTGDVVTNDVAIQWYAADAADGEFTPIDSVDTAQLTLTSDLAGKYLKAVATSGDSVVEIVSANPVVDADSLAGITAKLQDENWRLELTYGVDTNANEVLEAQLAEMGVTDVTVRTTAVTVGTPNPAAELGISTAADATNGDVTYFFMDPDDLTGWAGFTSYQAITPAFTLSRGGESVTFTPGRATTMPWDEARVRAMLVQDAAEALAIGFAEGDAVDAVTQDMTLPLELSGKSWSEVSWSSSNTDAVRVTGYILDDAYTGEVTRSSVDAEVTLTATVGISKSGGPEVTVDVPFTVTVKADPAAVEQACAELQAKVDEAFSAEALTYSEDGSAVDASAVSGDLQLPRPGTIAVDGKYYSVTYTASNDAVQINGYRGNVYQPLPGEQGEPVELTLTVTSKDNPEVTASKTIELVVAPLEAADLEAERDLMAAAKAGYAAAILNGQTADAVEGNLATFQKAYLDESGELAWARDYSTANAAGDGIVTDDLEPDDDMGVVAGHWYKSSNATVIAHDTLAVTRPARDTQVTITSQLSSERYARYAERYADDPTWGPVFAELTGQTVTATVTVRGTSGSTEQGISVTAQVVGVDAFGDDEVWAAPASIEVAQGTTAAELTETLLAEAGLEADAQTSEYGWYLNSITSPDGRVLGYDDATGKYWQLFVNGTASAVGAGSVVLQAGDEVVWYYSAYGASLDDIGTAKVTTTVQVIGPDAEGNDASWVGLTEVSLPEGSTVADLTERVLDASGIAHTATGVGTERYYLSSITSPYTGAELAWDEGSGKFWQLFVDGEPAEKSAGQITLEPGSQIVWYYSARGTDLPQNDVQVDPDAWDGRPSDWEAEWEGFATGAVENDGTPTEGGELAWSVDVGSDISSSVYASDPVIVEGRLYVAVGDKLKVYNAATGASLGSAVLATSIDSAARVVYSDGLIVVPLHDGRLQVLRADTLVTVTLTDVLAEGQQSLSSITVVGGYAYFGTTNAAGDAGAFFCVNLRTGAVRWSSTGSGDAGYYWTGAELTGDALVTVDGSGTVRSIDPATGDVLAELSLGSTVRSKPVAGPDDPSVLYVTSRDGVLHRIALGEDGSLSKTGSVSFAAYSTSTPTITGGRAYVGGTSADNGGVLAVIDLASMQVAYSVTTYGEGTSLPDAVMSTPTVSVRDGAVYVYFTCNAPSGAAYLYRVGDSAAKLLYLPSSSAAEWCTANVVVGADGAVYYLNDSGYLFKLLPGSAIVEPSEPGSGDAQGEDSAGNTAGSSTQIPSLRTSLNGMIGGAAGSAEGSLLGRFASDTPVATLLDGEEAVAATSATRDGMPLWPFVGMGLGALVLAAAWMTGRRREKGEGHA